MPLKYISFLLTFFIYSTLIFGQKSDSTDNMNSLSNSPFKDRLVFGGNIGANFGTRTFIEVSPVIGYRIKPKLITGIGINYNFFSDPFQKGTVYGLVHLLGTKSLRNYFYIPNFSNRILILK